MFCVACDRHHCLQVLGSNSPDAPWLKAITERVLAVYCDRLSGYAWTSQVSSPRCICLTIVHAFTKLQQMPKHLRLIQAQRSCISLPPCNGCNCVYWLPSDARSMTAPTLQR